MAVTKHLSILLTDIKGFTDKTSHQTRAAIDALLEDYKTIVLPVLEGRGGKLIKTIGDAYLMTFESPTDAVLAGVAVQDALRKRNEGRAPDDRIEVRIAINSGEVNIVDGDIFGEPVNITSRIESVAEAGEVFFTEAVYLAMNKAEVPSSEVDTYLLKGIAERVRVYKVRRETPVGSGEMREKKRDVREPAPKAVPAGAARPAPAPAAIPALPGGRKVLLRRGVATAIDFIICGILAGVLAPGDRTTVHVRQKKALSLPSGVVPEAPRGGTFRVDEKGLVIKGDNGSELQIGEQGLHARDAQGAELKIGEQGLQAKDARGAELKVGESGAVVRETKDAPEKAVDLKVGLDGLEVTEKSSDDEDDKQVRVETRRRSAKDRIFPFVWLLLNAVTLAAWGATPGKKLLHLKVVAFQDGGPIDNKTAFLRSLFTLLSAAPLGLGYLWAAWDKDRRGWHDLFAGTRVVEVDR